MKGGWIWVRVEGSGKDEPGEWSIGFYDFCAEPAINIYDALYCVENYT